VGLQGGRTGVRTRLNRRDLECAQRQLKPTQVPSQYAAYVDAVDGVY
jgi:hypothetical protein